MMRPASARTHDDAGMSLVELIIYGAITAVALTVLATLFASSMGAEAQTRDRDTATARSQVITASLQTSIRNASDMRVDGDVVRAVVATGTSGWSCQAWALKGDRLLYRTSSTALAMPDASGTGWSTLASGVKAAKSGASFSISGRTLNVSLSVISGATTVPATGKILAQAKQSGTVTKCW
jgi:hypothetical protein